MDHANSPPGATMDKPIAHKKQRLSRVDHVQAPVGPPYSGTATHATPSTFQIELAESDAQAELIIEHFGFTPLSCIDDIINAVNDILYQATSSLERFITKEMGECPEAEQGIHQIETLLENAVDKYFDIFELYSLRNIFSIPPDANITLPHHEGYDSSVTPEDEANLDTEISKIRAKLQAAQYFNRTLTRELGKVNQEYSYFRKLQPLAAFDYIAQAKDVPSVNEELCFIIDQTHAILTAACGLREQIVETSASTPFPSVANGQTNQSLDTRSQYLRRMVRHQLSELSIHTTD